MAAKDEFLRYSVIAQKNKREIVMLRGDGCKWKRCTFCDYHLDSSKNQEENVRLNHIQLSKITGCYGILEVINSGSFCDLDERTIEEIICICKEKNIHQVHFESHYMHRKEIPMFKERFRKEGIKVKIKMGIETFDEHMRQEVFCKGIVENDPKKIAQYIDEVCLLFGVKGQTKESMKKDVDIALENFERVCINIMVENSTAIKPDAEVIRIFKEEIAPLYEENSRVDILLENTDFGVGGKKNV